MHYIKENLINLKNSNLVEMVKTLTANEEKYLEYYAILRAKELVTFYDAINNNNLFLFRGACGSGKTSLKKLIKKSFDDNIKVFEYDCNEITELDDIFFKFYKFISQNPLKKEVFRPHKSNFNPPSIDEQIMQYVKSANNNFVIVLDNFEKLTDETGGLKAENIKSFIEFLSNLNNIKLCIFSTINVKNIIDVNFENTFEIKIQELSEKQFNDFISIFKIEISSSLFNDVYRLTNGYIYSLKFLSIASKILNLPINNILKEFSSQNLNLNEYLAKKIISKLSDEAKKVLFYLSLFRHELTPNILKNIDNFNNVQNELDLLKNYLLIEGDKIYEVREFIQNITKALISDRDKLYYHEKIANFYAEQIPLKPNERIIEISRTTMYAEKFYHQNCASKLNKNFELQSEKFKNNTNTSDNTINSQTIKYMASPNYLQVSEIKQTHKDILDNKKPTIEETNIEDIDNIDLVLTEEEKALLSNTIPDIMDTKSAPSTSSPLPSLFKNSTSENFTDNVKEMRFEETNENDIANSLLEKGVNLLDDGDFKESVSYIKNSMSYYQDNDNENYWKAKLALISAYIEGYRLKEAKNIIEELLNTNTSLEVQINALLEYATVSEIEKDTSFAVICYSDALNIALDNNLSKYCAKIYFQLALLRDDMQEYNLALENYLLAAKYAQTNNDYTILASSYSNIASIYEENDNLPKAIEYYKKSLKTDIWDANFEGQSKTLSALGSIFIKQNNIKSGINAFIKATQMAKQTTDSYLIAASYLELGDTFLNIKNYKNALKAYLLAQKNIDYTISTDSKNKIDCRFAMIVDEIGDAAYKFLLRELKTNARKIK